MRRLARFVVVLSMILLPAAASAEVTVRAYEEGKGDASVAESLRLYIAGVAEGYRVAELYGRRNRARAPLFCLPKAYTFGSIDYSTVVDGEIRLRRESGEKDLEDRFVEHLLLEALQKKYPCRGRGLK
jgi:hypothetical protein